MPFVGIFANCTAWLLYGTLTKDPYVYFSNILGLPIGIFFVFTALKFAPEKVSACSCTVQLLLLDGCCCQSHGVLRHGHAYSLFH